MTPLIYLCLSGLTLGYILLGKPKESISGLVLISIGFIVYVVAVRFSRTAAS